MTDNDVLVIDERHEKKKTFKRKMWFGKTPDYSAILLVGWSMDVSDIDNS
jgi:hypothetical protein